jgi:hypothetical protein
MPIDAVFILATAAFGFGLSLATYRLFAMRNGWPMGEWHRERPGLPIAIGVVAIAWSIMIGVGRGGTSAWVIPLFGLLVAAAWTGILKVGSQVSLILAPLVTVLLALSWIMVETPSPSRRSSFDFGTTTASVANDTIAAKDAQQRAVDSATGARLR